MSDTKISEFPEKALSSLDVAGTADFVGGYDVISNNKTNKRFSFSTFANWLLTKFKLTIAGSSQTVKSAVDTLNSKLYNYIGSFNSSSALETALDTLGGTVSERGSQNLSFFINTAFGLFSTSIYVGYMTKTGTNRYQLLMNENASNRKIYATKTANGWVWEIAPMRSEINTLNSNSYLLTGGTELTQNTNIDTITTPGNYGTYSSNVARTMSGLPFTTGSSDIFAFNLKVEHAAFNQEGIVRQTLRFFNDRYAYIRYKMSSSSSWGTWEKTPTRSEIDNAIMHNLTLNQELANGTDINTLTTPGTFICANGAISQTFSNWPAPGIGGRLEVISILRTTGAASTERLRQIVYCNNAHDTYQRVWNGSSWDAWEKLPLRSEIDALNRNNPDTPVDIRSYTTSSNYYLAQTDGYAQLQGTDCRLVLSPGGNSLIQSTGTLCGAYIKRGIKIYVIGSPTTANFIPLS